jgi:hypothetical protein
MVRVFAWVDQTSTDPGKAQSEAMRLVQEAFAQQGFSAPVPVRRVLLERRGEPAAAGALDHNGLDRKLVQASQVDVTPRNDVEEQVAHDRRVSDEQDLLSK